MKLEKSETDTAVDKDSTVSIYYNYALQSILARSDAHTKWSVTCHIGLCFIEYINGGGMNLHLLLFEVRYFCPFHT